MIPDSIEPVIGWKSWKIATRDPNLLVSRHDPHMLWEPNVPYEARCRGQIQYRYIWKQVRIEEIPDFPAKSHHAYNSWEQQHRTFAIQNRYSSINPPSPGDQFSSLWAQQMVSAMTAMSTAAFQMENVDPYPDQEPPEGMVWYLYPIQDTHETPSQKCSCGIYMADSPEEAANYGEIIGKVAGWGITVRGTSGNRVQYAYPQELWARTKGEQERLSVYGIPVHLRKDAKKMLGYELPGEEVEDVFVAPTPFRVMPYVVLSVMCAMTFVEVSLFLFYKTKFLYLIAAMIYALGAVFMGSVVFKTRK